MRSHLTQLTYEIEIQPGEKLTLPESLINSVSEGRWQLTIQPVPADRGSIPIRDHSAFLNSYAPSDEGLYDDYPTGVEKPLPTLIHDSTTICQIVRNDQADRCTGLSE